MVFKNADEAFSYIESFTNLERSPNLTAREYRLDRMYGLCELFSNPQRSFRSIHVAGSKGKGSTAAFTAAALKANGYKTGLYCSPHVESYKERISEAGEFFSDQIYAETAGKMFDVIEAAKIDRSLMGGEPTTFELLTLLSFLIFEKTGCEWAVFETGLGGRLDATNVIMPEASILTVIELEHTEYLGTTIPAVAREKAGIIKTGVPVFSAAQKPEAEEVFRAKAAECSSEIFFPADLIESLKEIKSVYGNAAELELKTGSRFSLSLRAYGSFQIQNSALAVSTLDYLKLKKTLFTNSFNPSKGIDGVSLPGRMELFSETQRRPAVMLDGAHTVNSVTASSDAFFSIYPSEAVLLFGSVEGKDASGMAERLCSRFSKIIITTPGTFKKSNPEGVYSEFRRHLPPGCHNVLVLEKNTEKAFKSAVEYGCPVFVAGSFYLAAEIRKYLKCFY